VVIHAAKFACSRYAVYDSFQFITKRCDIAFSIHSWIKTAKAMLLHHHH